MDRRLVVTLCATLVLSGCLDLFGRDSPNPDYTGLGWDGSDTTGGQAAAWPDLDGVRLVVLDVLDWPRMPEAIDLFEDLTGADVVQEIPESRAGLVEDLARDPPQHDVVFGIDQVELGSILAAEAIEPYTPLLARRIDGANGSETPWPATQFQHRFVAVQSVGGPEVRDLFDVREHRAETILADPATDPVGRAFLLTTIAYFGEDPSYYNWKLYWTDLLGGESCVTIASSYGAAYMEGLLGVNGTATHGISVGYTNDPAVLVANGTLDATAVPDMLLVDNQTWRHEHFSAIVAGTSQRAAAQAWQEFLLTDAFQKLVPEAGAYPRVAAALPDGQYEGAPEPGSFRPAFIGAAALEDRWATWSADLQALREAADCPS